MKNFNGKFLNTLNIEKFHDTKIEYQIAVLYIVNFLNKKHYDEKYDNIYCQIDAYFDNDIHVGDFFTLGVVLDNNDMREHVHFRFNFECNLEKDELSFDLLQGNFTEYSYFHDCYLSSVEFTESLQYILDKMIGE